MENASKALIIAGAILVSILIIGLGMTLYNNAAGTVNRANLDSTAVQQYNAEFTLYDGETNIKGSSIKVLIKNILTHNRTVRNDPSLWINVRDYIPDDIPHINEAEDVDMGNIDSELQGYNDAISTILSTIRDARTYKVVCGYPR